MIAIFMCRWWEAKGEGDERLLGAGHFSTVYKAILGDGTKVAVKIFKGRASQTIEQMKEAEILM